MTTNHLKTLQNGLTQAQLRELVWYLIKTFGQKRIETLVYNQGGLIAEHKHFNEEADDVSIPELPVKVLRE